MDWHTRYNNLFTKLIDWAYHDERFSGDMGAGLRTFAGEVLKEHGPEEQALAQKNRTDDIDKMIH